jgi:hypothetical protein
MENHLFMDGSPRFPIQSLDFLAAPVSIFGPKDGISLKVPLSVRRQKPISVLVKTGESFSEFLDLILSKYFRDATVVTPFLTWPLRPASGGPRQPCGESKPQKRVLVQLTSNDVECCLPWTGRERGLRFYRPKWQPSAKFHAF